MNLFLLHSDYYIKHGEGEKSIRKIFHFVEYDDFEKNFLIKFKEYINSKKIILPSSFNDQVLLVYGFNGHFHLENSFNVKNKFTMHIRIKRVYGQILIG